MNKRPTISLITAIRNCAETLTYTLESVLRQTVPPYEHIIVDGESADGSLSICEGYAAKAPYKVKILKRRPMGVYDALNCGLQAATGDICGILHGGDRFVGSDILETYTDCFARNPHLEVLYADIVYVDSAWKRGRLYSGESFTPQALKWGFMFPHPAMYVRRELFGRYGFYSTEYKIAGDYEWIVRVILKGGEKSAYIQKCMVEMSPGGVSAKLRNRLVVTPSEKLRALRANDIRVCPLRMAGRYMYALKTFLHL